MARLSTHVLDTARGRPAAGVSIRLYACEGESRRLLKTVATNADGRTGEPLLADDRIPAGAYELVFSAGDYFRANGETLPNPPFLDEVVVRFGIADAAGNYHVPLLLAPYGYSTYRGS
jgi:5-hydroxyisourate hydrolase